MFKDWVATVDRDPKLFVDDIHLQSVDMVGPRVGHVKFKTTARAVSAGRAKTVIDVPGIVFMRGGSVGVLVILECDGAEYTILTRQPRVPVGRHDFPEIPAGMLDGSGNFKGVAAEAIQRACGIVITEDELVDLTGLTYGDKFRGVVPSASGCDEYVKLYMMRRHVEEAVISDLQGRLNGISADGEPFKLQIVELKDAWQLTPDVKALSALALFKHLRDSARLPERALRGQASNGARRVTSIDALVEDASYAEAGSLVRYGRHFQSKFEGSTELTMAEESAAVEAASALPPGQSASVRCIIYTVCASVFDLLCARS
jgi:ADP-sugar diphosphatase